MAGFIDRLSSNSLINNIQSRLKEISSLGVRYDDKVVKNSMAIGATEGRFLKQGLLGDEALMYSLAMADVGAKKYIAFFDKEYATRREFLRSFSMNGEIQWILDTITDDAIVQDERNFFCYTTPLSLDVNDEVKEAYENNFKKLYTYFHFSDDITAWQYFYQLMVDGFLAFEIIWDDSADNIIGFKELDATTLRPGVEKQSDGTFKNVWYQNENDIHLKKKLYDSQVIYIAYAKGNSISRVSYIERLVRSFNLLRIMEHTRIIWSVMNASFRMKMVVPIGSKSPQKAKESLGELLSIYKEDVRLDHDSGELLVNGRPNIPFYKNYMFPNKNGEQVDIETIGGTGPELSDTAPLDYFYNKLKVDSKVPAARFDRSAGGGQFSLGSEGMDREEIRFSKFINRLRSIFQEILVKPMYLQMMKDFPDLADDEIFKSQIGIRFNKDNVFERMREMDVMNKTTEFLTGLKDLQTIRNGEEQAFFHPKFLVERYMFLPQTDLDMNEKYWKEDKDSGNSGDKAEEEEEGEKEEKDGGFSL